MRSLDKNTMRWEGNKLKADTIDNFPIMNKNLTIAEVKFNKKFNEYMADFKINILEVRETYLREILKKIDELKSKEVKL